MLNKIGEAAGAATVAKLITALKADTFELNAAIGWLAREDKIDVVKTSRGIQISLR